MYPFKIHNLHHPVTAVALSLSKQVTMRHLQVMFVITCLLIFILFTDISLQEGVCSRCGYSSPRIYKQGWMCTHPDCCNFFRISSKEIFLLDYDESFLKLRPHLDFGKIDLSIPSPLGIPGTHPDSIYSTKGWWCPQCGQLCPRWIPLALACRISGTDPSYRERWECWACTACNVCENLTGPWPMFIYWLRYNFPVLNPRRYEVPGNSGIRNLILKDTLCTRYIRARVNILLTLGVAVFLKLIQE